MTARRYLLDTNVISATRFTREHPEAVEFIRSVSPDNCYLSVMTLGEMRKGFVNKDRKNPQGAGTLGRWIDEIEAAFETRVLPVDALVAKAWGELHSDRTRSAVDSLLAATAVVHKMAMVTRNTRDFLGLPIELINPWHL